MSQPIGAHVPAGEPLAEAAVRSADVAQVFLSNPQSWKKPITRDDADELRASPIPLFVHAPYLINPVAENNRIRIPSRRILQETCDAAEAIGAEAVVVHGGQVTGGGSMDEAIPRWRKAFEAIDTGMRVLIENTAGGDQAVARTSEGIAELLEALADYDVGFVLDTCHAWAAGEGPGQMAERVMSSIGRIDLVHLNDSRDEIDSRRDRHTNLGDGLIPEEELVAAVEIAQAPVVVETPGEAADHRRDIEWIRGRLLK